jgi:hypothetical protein
MCTVPMNPLPMTAVPMSLRRGIWRLGLRGRSSGWVKPSRWLGDLVGVEPAGCRSGAALRSPGDDVALRRPGSSSTRIAGIVDFSRSSSYFRMSSVEVA